MIVGLQLMLEIMAGDALPNRGHATAAANCILPFKHSLGKVIDRIVVKDDLCTLQFVDGSSLAFEDQSSCCEHRYFTCPDDLAQHSGARFMDCSLRQFTPTDAADAADDDDGNAHEQSFLNLVTTKGEITVTAHNEHNGYYGGFSLRMLYHEHGASHASDD